MKKFEVETREYKLFDDEPEITVYKLDNNVGSVYQTGTFLQACIERYFTDYDGFGSFLVEIDNDLYEIHDVGFSIDEDSVYYKGAYVTSIFDFCNKLSIEKLVWYNK